MKPNVYLPQEPMRKDPETQRWVSKGLNLSAATEYGNLLIVWGPDASIMTRELVCEQAQIAASQYDDTQDWIVAVGSPTLIAALAHAIGVAGKRLRILEWDRANHRYSSTLGNSIEKGTRHE